MRYVGTEQIICSICKVELDVPVYQTNENKKYGMKFCHQCGNKLFSDEEEVIFMSDREEWNKRSVDYYLPEKVKDWWNSLTDNQKDFWMRRAKEERMREAGKIKPMEDA